MRITVIGDTLLDEDIEGTATRLSPDAPVPVVEIASRTRRAGGAGLVATMLARDGVDVELVTALAEDDAAEHVRDGLAGVRIVAGPSGAPTPVKARLRADGHPLARMDEGCAPPPRPRITPAMLAAVRGADALIVADYGRGIAAHPAMREALASAATRAPLVWDPHPRGSSPVRTARLVTPNRAEAAAAAGVALSAAHSDTAVSALRHAWGCEAIAITLGEQGAVLSPDAHAPTLRFSAEAVETSDPCGAGDRFAASAALALARGDGLVDAVCAAVDAASTYLAAGGVSTLAQGIPPRLVRGESDALVAAG